MAFPLTPLNGDIHGEYIYDATKAAWKKIAGVVESGTGYVKLIDGTLVQWGTTGVIGTNISKNAVANTTGTIYHSDSQTSGFNVPFINNNIVLTFNAGQGGYPVAFYSHSLTTTTFSWYVWTTVAGDSMSKGAPWMAIGRWK